MEELFGGVESCPFVCYRGSSVGVARVAVINALDFARRLWNLQESLGVDAGRSRREGGGGRKEEGIRGKGEGVGSRE